MNKINIVSEIGKLERVLLHSPGKEIERMTPENAHQALYSDILNLSIVQKEYDPFYRVISKWAQTYEIKDLLAITLNNEDIRRDIVVRSCKYDNCEFIIEELLSYDDSQLAAILIEGYEYQSNIHPASFANERYILKPLYNLYYTRDAAVTIGNSVIINPMAYNVRKRESLIMKTLFKQYFKADIVNPCDLFFDARIEGGDILVARDDLLCIGMGSRTNKAGIDFMINRYKSKNKKFNLLIQELPEKPESFIHLDMVFTFLDVDKCMIYEPLIKKKTAFGQYTTTHIEIDHNQVYYHEKIDFMHGLKDLGFDMQPIFCGGKDTWNQAREQWNSGANFFAFSEGKIIGYERNQHTIEALFQAGFEVLKAEDVCNGKADITQYDKCVVTFEASELPRGGGGARCMTMPIARSEIK